MDYTFPRYLAAKRSVDDRALNRLVWSRLAEEIAGQGEGFSIVEVGAGTGTMLQRLVEWGALHQGYYLGIDVQPENIRVAWSTIPTWATERGLTLAARSAAGFKLEGERINLRLELETIDLLDFLTRETGKRSWDVLIAHAFLDLFDIPRLMPELLQLVRRGGLLYLTINFDGHTIFEPVGDAALEEKIIRLYHRSMDERVTDGRLAGDSRAGRHLFGVLAANGLEVLAAGSSDWVVYPRDGQYLADEAYFLHHILHFFEETLPNRPEITTEELQTWAGQRHAQVERGELVYLAHQLDFLVRRPF